jgi:ActR/RegA family two-component response regulator
MPIQKDKNILIVDDDEDLIITNDNKSYRKRGLSKMVAKLSQL